MHASPRPPRVERTGASDSEHRLKVEEQLGRILSLLERVNTQNEMIIRQNVEVLLALSSLAEEGRNRARTDSNTESPAKDAV